jgi:hypothetical protein
MWLSFFEICIKGLKIVFFYLCSLANNTLSVVSIYYVKGSKMNKIVALMLIAAFAVVAGCAKAPAEEEVVVEEVVMPTAEEVVMPTAEEVVVEETTEEVDAAMEVEVY